MTEQLMATDGHEFEEITEITREMKEPHKQPWENIKNFVRTCCSAYSKVTSNFSTVTKVSGRE